MDVHKIQLRPVDDGDGISTGTKTEVLLDGKPLSGVTAVSINARGGPEAVKVTIEMVGSVDACLNVADACLSWTQKE